MDQTPQAYNMQHYGSPDRDAGWSSPMYGQYGGGVNYSNPYQMQQSQLQQIFAPWGGNPYNVGPMMAQQVNRAGQDYQAAKLMAMPYNNQAMGIQNQRLNFQDLIAALPQLLGAFSGHILGGQQGGFQTNYGAGASMGDNPLSKTIGGYQA